MRQRLRQLKYAFKMRLDPELRAIRTIILNRRQKVINSAAEGGCDQVFIERLRVYPKALKLAFWKKHFEWRGLLDYPEISGRILDFGCGSGHSDIFLARQGYLIHGVDLSGIGIDIANYLRDREPVNIRQRLVFQQVDITNEMPQDNLCDAAWASHVFEHIADPGPILAGLRRWLKPGAYLLISVPLGRAYDDPSHVNHYDSPEELRIALEKYILVERVDCNQQYQVLRALCRFGA